MILAVLRVLYSLLYTDFIQSEHTNVKILKYAHNMAIVGLLDFKTDASSFYFDTVDNFWENGRSVNLLINAKKTKEMVLSFSRTFATLDTLILASKKFHTFEFIR